MSIHDLFALLIASLTLSTAIMVVLSRNAVYAAFYLLLTLLGVAAEYALLHAHFLAVIQILVYAGAVIVLIVFVLMMMGFGREQVKGFKVSGAAVVLPLLLGGVLIAAGGVGLIQGNPLRVKSKLPTATAPLKVQKKSIATAKTVKEAQAAQKAKAPEFGSIKAVGRHLLTHGVLAFEIISILLLMAIAGVVMLLRERKVPQVKRTMATKSTPETDKA